MAISEKIVKKIENLDTDEKIKHLMMDILLEEDRGIYKYKETYEELINKYIEENKAGELLDD